MALNASQAHVVEDQNAVLKVLGDPKTHGLSSPPIRIDTHGAVVFLAGENAYKVKRTVKFPFMDLSTSPGAGPRGSGARSRPPQYRAPRGQADTLFDAVEFDDAIVTGDVLYDLAFLLMDLWARGLKREANLVLNRYLWGSGEEQLRGLAALPIFLSIRAKVIAASCGR